MNCVIGLDIGTTVMKCCILSQEGEIVVSDNLNNHYKRRAGDIVEFNAEERYDDICKLIQSVVAQKPKNSVIAGLCIAGASGNALLLDAEKKPLMNAVSWLDQRAASVYSGLIPFSADEVFNICGWPLIGSFPLSFFAWMKENETDIYNTAGYYATDFVYYNHRLTGNWVIDASTATNFYLADQANQKYHQPFLDFLSIDKHNLPELINSGTIIGCITAAASEKTLLPEGTPVIAGSFDHPAAARGAGILESGDILLSCGTSWVLFFPINDRKKAIKNGMLVDPFLHPSGPWGAMASFTAIGITIDEYLNLLFNNDPNRFAKFDEAVIDSFNAEGACDFDLLQRNIAPELYVKNLLEVHSLSSVCRAIMENMATLLCQKISLLKQEGFEPQKFLMTGGFSKSRIWPRVLANSLSLPVQLVTDISTGCVGACILAGMGIGWWENEKEGFNRLKIRVKTVLPQKTKI